MEEKEYSIVIILKDGRILASERQTVSQVVEMSEIYMTSFKVLSFSVTHHTNKRS